MTPDFVIGVDPGLKGAVALYNVAPLAYQLAHPELITPNVAILDMPTKDGKVDAPALADKLTELAAQPFALPARIVAVVEHVASRPRQQGAFAFGLSTGVVHGVLATLGIPFETIAPSVWKPAMGLRRQAGESEADNKSRARALAAQLFPNVKEQFERVKDDGRAEALLLAVYYANRVHPTPQP